MSSSLYEELGVDRTANLDEIKKAYRRLAMKHHPDKVESAEDKPKAEERFKRITEAYTILSDDEKRQLYDMTGSTEAVQGPGGGGGPFGPGFGPGMDPSDIFRQMFGNMFGGVGGNGGGGGGNGPGKDVMRCQVSLEEVYTGITKKIEYDVVCACHQCDGIGAMSSDDIVKCLTCQGNGVLFQRLGPMTIQTGCHSCQGKKMAIRSGRACSHCKGEGVASYKKTLKLALPRGIPDRYESTFSKKGNYQKESKVTNDLLVVFEYTNLGSAIIQGANIVIPMTISLDELLCGFIRTVNLYGVDLKIASGQYLCPTKPVTIPKRGLPVFGSQNKPDAKSTYGDLILNVTVQYPEDDKVINKYHDVFLKIFKKTDVQTLKDQSSFIWIFEKDKDKEKEKEKETVETCGKQ
jgi:DnaJ-class molecular chaperone